MKKRFLTLLVASFSLCFANPLNWVVAKVNNEPITNYEVADTMKKLRTNDEKTAINFLINKKLQDSEIKRLDIAASPFEISERTKELAKSNNMSVEEFNAELKRRGISKDEFNDDIAQDIKNEKFYQTIFAKADRMVNPENVRRYYDQNPTKFTTFEAINVTRFAAETRKEIENVVNGKGVGSRVYSHKIQIKRDSLNDQTAFVFMNTKDGGFTPIMQAPQGFYEVLRIDSKVGYKTLSFEEAGDSALAMFVEDQRKMVTENHFERLRSQAVVEYMDKK